MPLRPLLASLAILAAVTSTAVASRAPRGDEGSGIKAAVRIHIERDLASTMPGTPTISKIRVSTVKPQFAIASYTDANESGKAVLDRGQSTLWSVTAAFGPGKLSCTKIPKAVRSDLKVPCRS